MTPPDNAAKVAPTEASVVEAASLARPEPPLSDGVIVLRAWHDEDVDPLVAACQDAAIQQFIPIPRPYHRDHAVNYVEHTRRQWDEGTKAAFAVADASDQKRLLGAIDVAIFGATGNAAYWVAPAARRSGVAVRALRLLTDWALDELRLALVMLEIRPENLASQHVAERAGFHVVGHLDVNDVTGDRDSLIYSRLAPAVSGPARRVP